MTQLALFPEAVEVRALDPRAVAGPRTRVSSVWMVRYERDPGPHRVFADRHGWYCEAHGAECRAVEEARVAHTRGEDAEGAAGAERGRGTIAGR